MYRGSFTLADFAAKMVPLARGGVVLFDEGTLDGPARAWRGTATCYLIKRCFVLSCFGLALYEYFASCAF